MALQLIGIIFDGPPDHDDGRFMEVEDAEGRNLSAGEWRELERNGERY